MMLGPCIEAFCTSFAKASKVESLSDDVLAEITSLPHNGSSVRRTSDSSIASQSAPKFKPVTASISVSKGGCELGLNYSSGISIIHRTRLNVWSLILA